MKNNYLLGMLGPVNIADFRDYIFKESWRDDLPKGMGGTPVNLLSIELLKRGQRLVIFSLDPTVLNEVILDGPNLRICIEPFRPRAKHRALDFFATERKYLLEAIKREMPDILHAQWTYEYAIAAQSSGLPHVITAHDAPINIVRHNFSIYRIIKTIMAYRVLMRANRVISVSPYVADHLRNFMFYLGKQKVVPNGMSARQFESAVEKNIDKDKLTFASILPGWGGLKNGQVAIKAFAIHRKTRPNDKLIMFGHGHGVGEAAAHWATVNGFAAGIEFSGHTPYQKLMDRLASEVDVLVHPSLEEAQPMVLIEAMALKIPVIGGKDSGGVPWTLDDGKAGLLVDISSPDAVAASMHRLAFNEAFRIDIGQRGRDLAFKRFHIKYVANAYESIYRELVVNI